MSFFYRVSLLLSMVLVILPLGCQMQNDDTARNNNNNNAAPQRITYDTTNQNNRNQNNGNQNNDMFTRNQQAANRFVDLANKVSGVKGATAVVLGNYTLVGLDVDPQLDRSKVGTIKKSVAEALQNDPQGKNALVTADVDLVQRIRSSSQKIADGRPVAAIMDELADIAGRIAPQPSNNATQD